MNMITITSPFIFLLRGTMLGTLLADAWRRLAPPLPWRKRFYGVSVFINVRDCAFWLFKDTDRIERSEHWRELLNTPNRMAVWDVGCNVGVMSLLAASMGHDVTAFDISGEAVNLLNDSACLNKLRVNTVCRALGVSRYSYTPPKTADLRNKPCKCNYSADTSLTYAEAEVRYGTPQFIKMDIEGGEVDFLKDGQFVSWLRANGIAWLVELHNEEAKRLALQLAMETKATFIDEGHVLFHPL